MRLGEHVVADVSNVSPHALRVLEGDAVLRACSAGPVDVLRDIEHRFDPQGYTRLLLLAESHLALHTWPERRAVALDVFSCGERGSARRIVDELLDALGGGLVVELREVVRGEM